MTALFILLLILAAACFIAAALGATLRRVNLMALGLFLWVLVPLIKSMVAID